MLNIFLCNPSPHLSLSLSQWSLYQSQFKSFLSPLSLSPHSLPSLPLGGLTLPVSVDEDQLRLDLSSVNTVMDVYTCTSLTVTLLVLVSQ